MRFVGFFTKSFFAALLMALLAVNRLPRSAIPPHLTGHTLIDLQGFLSPETVEDLLAFTRELGVIPSAAREYDSYAVTRDHIGEAVPYDKALGKCPGDFLMTDANLSRCIFPGRIDVGRHFIASGGSAEGLKERYETLLGRVQPFQRLIFNYKDYPTTTRLLDSPAFRELSLSVCPKDKQVLDTFQTNLVVQVPGQTVAAHIDAPYFMRANRFGFPQWYLAVMVFSGLFKEDFVDQVQVVGYYHKWTDVERREGKFFFWNSPNPKDPPEVSLPLSGNANAVDGSKVVHAASVYFPDRAPPKMPRTNVNELRYRKEEDQHHWDVVSNGQTVASYPEDDIRFSVVYRGRCFASEAQRLHYHSEANKKAQFTLEETNSVFVKDLIKRGVLASEAAFAAMSPYDFGLLLLDTYIKYPTSHSAFVPFNYCAIDRVVPFLAPVVKALCK